jgi:subtilisin family serine protease
MLPAALPLTAWAAQPATWNFQQIGVPAAQPLGNSGKGVLVAVVDTWVDASQPQFAGRVVDEADCLPGTCQDHAYAPDSCVHGTHVAGTIASANYGVAPEASILAVEVLSGPAGASDPSASCSGSADAVAAGIDFAVGKGARVINLSLADEVPFLFQPTDQAITNAVSNAFSHGVAVVIAAGNDSVPLSDSYGSDALVVAATGPSGQIASYSNSGPFVSVAAPGGDSGANDCAPLTCVLSTFPGTGFGLLEGTSMAAPHVSGLAALLFGQSPARSLADLFSVIEHTATPLGGGGFGLVNAAKALQAEPVPHPAVVPAAAGRPASAPSSGAAARAASGQGAPVSVSSPTTANSSGLNVPVGSAAPTTTHPSASATTAPASSTVPAAAGAPGAVADARLHPTRGTTTWASRNAAVLTIACLLLAISIGTWWWRARTRPAVRRAH